MKKSERILYGDNYRYYESDGIVSVEKRIYNKYGWQTWEWYLVFVNINGDVEAAKRRIDIEMLKDL